jgi:hypothetical protein
MAKDMDGISEQYPHQYTVLFLRSNSLKKEFRKTVGLGFVFSNNSAIQA